MTASNVGPGGVRNLRAMFENKANDQSTSPPSRGRSPSGSVSSSHSRPVSKVRTSFVAVERTGDGEFPSQLRLRKASDATMDGTTEYAVAGRSNLGNILKGSPFEERPAPIPEHEAESVRNGVSDRADAMVKKMQQGDGKPPPSGKFVNPNEVIKHHPPPRPKPRSNIQTDQPSTGGIKSPKEIKNSPTAPKGPLAKPKGGGQKILGVMESAARAREGRAATAAQANSDDNTGYEEANSGAASAKPAIPKGGGPKIQGVLASAERARAGRASAAADLKGESVAAPPASRLPRASLPARSLPSAATTATTSSVAKTDAKPVDAKAGDKKPTARAAPRVASATTASSLAKKTSRASLNPNENSKSKSTTSRPADEGFLARMTRPTASSAQKAHDKITPPSPPQAKVNPVGKSSSTRPSRKSLSRADMHKESNDEISDVPAVPELPASNKVQDTTKQAMSANGVE